MPELPVPQARAARELGVRRDEFRLAVDLGFVRTVPGSPPGTADAHGDPARRRVPRAEIERLKAAPDFPEGLRERVKAVGTAEGAELLSVTRDRFARLARTGHFSPVRFYVNRYRAVVWLYPAAELAEFALNHPRLLSGRLPLDVRTRADDGRQDWRPRNWRARRLGALLRASGDPWVRTAAIASLLDAAHVAEVVDDLYERVYLDRLRPGPPVWRPNAPAAREIADRLMLADDPDEILWHRMSLGLALDEARAEREAPRPGMPSDVASPSVPALQPMTSTMRGRRATTVTSPEGAPSGTPMTLTPSLDDFGAMEVRAGRWGSRPVVSTPAAPAPPARPAPPTPPASSTPPVFSTPPGSSALQAAPSTLQDPPTPHASSAPLWPATAPQFPSGRPAGVRRPPGRRFRRSLLDRLRRRKEATPRPGG
ncbi:DUF6397 family protein [Streptomyces sp. NPDC012637]|uniref:DUF6397 family protein n=1 Tax=Streptomyces sp. NPDC012637 TaxID=3364842 RepID=UPI0036F0A9BC